MNTQSAEKNIINLSQVENSTAVLFEITKLTENEEYKNKKITLNVGALDLSEAHMLSIKTILSNFDIELELIHTDSPETQLAAINAGLAVLMNGEAQSVISNEQTTANAGNKSGNTFYLKHTVRSGQTVEFDGNVVVIGDCNPGSEIIASGDVVVWGILAGIAHAGASGNTNASIKALKINAIQLRVANLIARRPDRIKVNKMERKDTYVPEEARIENNEIIIYSLNG